MKSLLRLAIAVAVGLLLLPEGPALAQDAPEVVYEKFHRAARAVNVKEMAKLSTVERNREDVGTPKWQLTLFAETLPESYQITGKKVSPDGNTIQLRASGMHVFLVGKKKPMYGIVDLVRQKGEWKVDSAGWAQDQWPDEEPGAARKKSK